MVNRGRITIVYYGIPQYDTILITVYHGSITMVYYSIPQYVTTILITFIHK